ncbi:MAG: sensor histidine kinase N-terminal domain-containing protein [Arenimonas sp.]|uniref:ATP-binding protein n=1 Tax=Arenimonas sp. TaxID=1872635 RepID=UPI0025C27190|nr:ATP-binding protein [Arenimonas sp.]MBW8368229.1 sensor histidine kinase N-terminal domain-containing protein [Arenimonas sp.]
MVLALVGTLSAGIAVAAGFSYKAGLQEANELFDAKLAHSARVLMSLVDEPLADEQHRTPGGPMVISVWHGNGRDLVSAGGHAYETKLAFQVRDAGGQLLLRSESGPVQALAALAPGYADVTLAGSPWRTFTLRAPSGLWYQASEQSEIREEMAGDIAFGTLVPLFLSLPIMAFMIWLAVCWASRGLLRISEQIEARAPDRLAPIELGRVPKEIQGLAKAVNGLLARVEAGLARERRFTADAAHELRTPVAAVKIHADNLRNAVNDAERLESQQRLDAGVRRMERAIAQLLALSRVEPGAAPQAREPVDLAQIVAHHAGDARTLAEERDIEVRVQAQRAMVAGDSAALDGLVRNLLDNAVRYTPAAGQVSVRLASDAGQVHLVVEDSGPGIAPEARERVFERFQRELGTGVEGSGLGLSIVAQVLASHGGRIALDASPALGGLRASVTLPAA